MMGIGNDKGKRGLTALSIRLGIKGERTLIAEGRLNMRGKGFFLLFYCWSGSGVGRNQRKIKTKTHEKTYAENGKRRI